MRAVNMSFSFESVPCLTAHVGIGEVPLPKVLYHNTISSGPDTSTSANNSTVSLDKSRLPLYLSPTISTNFLLAKFITRAPPLGPNSFITGRNEVGPRSYFHKRVSVHGRSASVHAGIHPPKSRSRSPLGADSPPEQTPPEQTPPGADTPQPPWSRPPQSRHPRSRHPPRAHPPRKADSSIRSTSGRYASY